LDQARGANTPPIIKSEKFRKGKNMAMQITMHQGPSRTLRAFLRVAADAALQHAAAWFAYRRTVRELSDLSNRDLADLGLHRSEIRRVAHDSVYGARR